MEYIAGAQGVAIKDFFREIYRMVMDRCFGKMEVYTEDGGETVLSTAKDSCL